MRRGRLLEAPALAGVLSILAVEMLTCQVLAHHVTSATWRDLLERVVPAIEVWNLVDPVRSFGLVNALLVLWLWTKWRSLRRRSGAASGSPRVLCVALAVLTGVTQWAVVTVERVAVLKSVDALFAESHLIRVL